MNAQKFKNTGGFIRCESHLISDKVWFTVPSLCDILDEMELQESADKNAGFPKKIKQRKEAAVMFGECHMHMFMNGTNYKKAVELHRNGAVDEDIHQKFAESYKRYCPCE